MMHPGSLLSEETDIKKWRRKSWLYHLPTDQAALIYNTIDSGYPIIIY